MGEIWSSAMKQILTTQKHPVLYKSKVNLSMICGAVDKK